VTKTAVTARKIHFIAVVSEQPKHHSLYIIVGVRSLLQLSRNVCCIRSCLLVDCEVMLVVLHVRKCSRTVRYL